ncbi:hypothetical protein PENTCL1PPCAC_15568, partial [Pristionchus entomophagus]
AAHSTWVIVTPLDTQPVPVGLQVTVKVATLEPSSPTTPSPPLTSMFAFFPKQVKVLVRHVPSGLGTSMSITCAPFPITVLVIRSRAHILQPIMPGVPGVTFMQASAMERRIKKSSEECAGNLIIQVWTKRT